MKSRIYIIILILTCFIIPSKSFAECGSHWKRGMWIGAASGAFALGMSLGLLAATSSNSDSSDGSDFKGFSQTTGGLIFGIGGAAAGALIGMGIGTAIGAGVKKKNCEVSVVPIVSPDKNNQVYGLALQKRF